MCVDRKFVHINYDKKEAAVMDGGSVYHADTDEIRKRMPALPVPEIFPTFPGAVWVLW
ncbi:MAG: hypothetical protein HFG54_05330 [Lachnospiraceae bacterium]|nr:hypothetical protein [Lachnospiraceae bacterium]